MPSLNFENVINSVLGNFNVSGEVHLHEGVNTGGIPAVRTFPATTFQTDQDIQVHFNWNQSGWLARFFSGQWQMAVYLEMMGQGETTNPTPINVPYIANDPQSYSRWVVIPRNTLSPGVYRVVACLRLIDSAGTMTPLASFTDIGLIQVYND